MSKKVKFSLRPKISNVKHDLPGLKFVCEASSKIFAAATISDIPTGLYKSPSRSERTCLFDISSFP